MIFNNHDDDEREDFFEDTPSQESKKPKAPKIPETSPEYWLRESGRWDHLKPLKQSRTFILTAAGAVVVFVIVLWMAVVWIFGVRTLESVVYGYVDDIERRGVVIKTYEGRLIPYKEIHDTTRNYTEDFTFSIPDSHANILASYRDSGKPLKITYRTYNSAMPWRGENRRVAERVDTIDLAAILPAELDGNPNR